MGGIHEGERAEGKGQVSSESLKYELREFSLLCRHL